MSNINININLNDLGKWFEMIVDRFQHLSGTGILLVILALFFPPLAALIKVGFTLHFWINVVLTMLGIVPGQIHALWLVLFN